jgi:hypothetical protein
MPDLGKRSPASPASSFLLGIWRPTRPTKGPQAIFAAACLELAIGVLAWAWLVLSLRWCVPAPMLW